MTEPSPSPDLVAAADRAAAHAAAAAGVAVRDLDALDELQDVSRLFEGIWRRDDSPPMATEVLRALAKAGNYVAGAYDGPLLVGACVGFFGAPSDRSLHSHISGVAPPTRNRHIGFALKVHQRSWALRRGVLDIAWTFDPLVARNAHVNLTKLAAEPREYLPNFYGGTDDGLDGGVDGDRFLVRWPLSSAVVAAACLGRPRPADARVERSRGATVALGVSDAGHPVRGDLGSTTSLVAIPSDIESLRREDPGLAHRWRTAVRDALSALMGDGALVTGYDRAGWYVLRRPAPVLDASDQGA